METISELPLRQRRLDVDVVIIHLYVGRDGRANTAVYPPRPPPTHSIITGAGRSTPTHYQSPVQR